MPLLENDCQHWVACGKAGLLTAEVKTAQGATLFKCSAPINEWCYSSHMGVGGATQYEIYGDGFQMPRPTPGTSRDLTEVQAGPAGIKNDMTLVVEYAPQGCNLDLEATIAARAGGSY